MADGAAEEKVALSGAAQPEPLTASPLPSHHDVSCCNRACLGWVYPLVFRAWRDRIKPEMTPALSPHLASATVVDKVSALWSAEKDRASSGKSSASIVPAFRKLMGTQLLKGMLIGVLQGLLSVVFRPIVLNVLIDLLAKPEIPAFELVLTVSAFAAVTLGDIWTATFARYYIHVDCGSQFVCATSGLILQKACTVRLSAPSADTEGGKAQGGENSPRTAQAKTPAEISNLLGNDVLQTQVAFMYLSFVPWR